MLKIRRAMQQSETIVTLTTKWKVREKGSESCVDAALLSPTASRISRMVIMSTDNHAGWQMKANIASVDLAFKDGGVLVRGRKDHSVARVLLPIPRFQQPDAINPRGNGSKVMFLLEKRDVSRSP